MIGTKGQLIQDTYGHEPRLYPKNHPASKTPPPRKLKRIAHQELETNWVEVIKGKVRDPASAFEYAAQLTEVMLLGVVALRAGTEIHYDGAKMEITNSVATSDQPLEGEQRAAFKSTSRLGSVLIILYIFRPGINRVIGAATIRARLEGLEVIGIRDGFEWIMQGDIDHPAAHDRERQPDPLPRRLAPRHRAREPHPGGAEAAGRRCCVTEEQCRSSSPSAATTRRTPP